jgi:hypothetical protein
LECKVHKGKESCWFYPLCTYTWYIRILNNDLFNGPNWEEVREEHLALGALGLLTSKGGPDTSQDKTALEGRSS